MNFKFPKKINPSSYKIYEESLYDNGKWVKTIYTVKKRKIILGIPVWIYLWDSGFNTIGFKTRSDAHSKIAELEKNKNKTGWSKVLIEQTRFDH